MRRLLQPAAVTLLALGITGCATMNVSSYVRRGLDFTAYRTFDWGPADELPAADPRLAGDPFFKDHLEGAIEKGLAGRGFQRSASDAPDLLIHYHAAITPRIDVNRLNKEYGHCYDYDCPPKVIQFEATTLVLDIVEARTNRVIWRGWAQHGAEDVIGNHDRMARRIEQAVSGMLAQLPSGGAPRAALGAR